MPPAPLASEDLEAISEVTITVARAQAAQAGWAELTLRDRLEILGRARLGLVERAGEFAACLEGPVRSRADALSSEVLPLADAIRFLERRAVEILKPRRLGRRGRPRWLFAAQAEIHREPLGLVLVIGPGNYPLLLPGVQILQALAAGNGVLIKPAPGASGPLRLLLQVLGTAGLPDGLCTLLDGSVVVAEAALEAEVDKVVLTGSAATGRRVLSRLAQRIVPAVTELSGNDPVIVLPGADLDLAVAAVAYGLRLNGSATCIAPRRVILPQAQLLSFEARLTAALAGHRPVPLTAPVAAQVQRLLSQAEALGVRVTGPAPDWDVPAMAPLIVSNPRADLDVLKEDVFAPLVSLIPVADGDEALDRANASPFALGASIFGPEDHARYVADRVIAGAVTINDIIVPTADPRLPFGGRRRSGFGSTRGAEGLLEMTAIKTISLRKGRFRPHFEAPRDDDEALFLAYIQAAHGARLGARLAAVGRLFRLLKTRG